MNNTLNAAIETLNATLNKLKKGDKVDRDALAAQIQKKHNLSEGDSASLVGILLRTRDDFKIEKGRHGGTTKL